MATPTLPVVLKKPQEDSLLNYAKLAQQSLWSQYSMRAYLLEIDQVYMREKNWTEKQWKARLANRAGDQGKLQDVTVPIVMPQVEAALGYMVNVFCTGNPVFGVTADPQYEDQAMMMETVVAENAVTAGWVRQLMMFFRDGLKYNLHGLECSWEQRTSYSIETDAAARNSAKPKQGIWEGNVLRRLDLYNTFYDPRVHPAEIHSEGEYAGYIQMMSRVRLEKFIRNLWGKVQPSTKVRAFESAPTDISMTGGGSIFGYYIPLINPFPLMQRNIVGSFDWMSWVSNEPQGPGKIRYNNAYQVMTLYARIIPYDFSIDVPDAKTPQVWKFIIVNNSVILFAEHLTNAHDFIPMFFGQPLEDGLDYQTKSFAQNSSDMQAVASAFMNGFIASKRRLVTDRVLYDPSRITKKDISSTDPAAKIPVRPSAYGKNLSESVYQFPFKDDQTESLISGISLVQRWADLINGQNPAQQGQFVKGNKTKHEYEDVMGHGNNKNQTMALMTEFQVFVPMKEAIKLNILQYQQDAEVFNQAQQAQVKVSTTDLRKAAVHFKVSDGIQPTDKLMDGDEWSAALQAIATPGSPIASGFNVAPLFSYLNKTRGVDLTPFEKSPLQVQFEQMQAQWQQVAMQAIKAGQPAPPQPQMPPELVQELQQRQQPGGTPPSKTSQALESTQGS